MGLIALVVAAIFFGAAIYINWAEQPARLLMPPQQALIQWEPSYSRGFSMQATLAVLSGFCGIAAWLLSGLWWWLVGALLILANWPFTMVVIMPVNRRLIAIAKAVQADEAETLGLLRRWGELHGVRSMLSFLAVAAYLIAALSS